MSYFYPNIIKGLRIAEVFESDSETYEKEFDLKLFRYSHCLIWVHIKEILVTRETSDNIAKHYGSNGNQMKTWGNKRLKEKFSIYVLDTEFDWPY